jgi:hypothetical protein
VVDLTKFVPKQEPREGLLWVLEEIPGMVHAEVISRLQVQQCSN